MRPAGQRRDLRRAGGQLRRDRYLGRKVYPVDVAMMMALLKIARIKANKGYEDGYTDLAGYAACGAECAMPPAEAKEESVRIESYWPDFVKAKQAEGCEELVQDAPRTKEELYSKILESNPATYGRAHKPTGEELAEMAEEDAHG